jgi:hypothetical protein
MQLFCPACQAAFSGESRCPRCGGLLLMPQEAVALPPRTHDSGYEPYSPSSTNRIVTGTVLALVFDLAVRQLTSGWLLTSAVDAESWWLSFEGLQVVLGIQTAAVIFGAVLAAAGRPQGYFLGTIVGGLCGLLFLGAEVFGSGAPVLDLVMLVQPGVLLVTGAIAGVAGSRVWPTPPDVEKPLPTQPKLSSIQLGTEEIIHPGRPTNWVRIVVGTLVMVAGVTQADKSRFYAQKYSGGALHVQSQAQGKFLSLQLATLAALIGAGFAGACTGAGLRHGLLTGALAGAGVIAIGAATGEVVAPIEYWLGKLQMNGLGWAELSVMATVAMSVTMVGIVGGWLGGALFPPLAPAHMRGNKLRLGED